MNKRLLFTIFTIFVIALIAIVAAFIGKGYRLSSQTGAITTTGIISVTSVPDQASVYLDDHLITATNTNINSLDPKSYKLRIVKEGFVPWEKNIEVKKGLVTEIKAILFPALPSIYPLTYNGVSKLVLSPDAQKLAYIVPGNTRKSGIWVWTMKDEQIGFVRGAEPHQIMQNLTNLDLDKFTLKFSSDSKQILASVDNNNFLLDADKLNDNPRDITPVLSGTLKTWEEDQKNNDYLKFSLISDQKIKSDATNSAILKFSPDEKKLLYSKDGKTDFKTVDLKTGKTYSLGKAYSYEWLPDSLHLVVVDLVDTKEVSDKSKFPYAKASVMEFDGTNKAEMYVGNFDPASVSAWPDSSRLVILYSVPTTTGSTPNLFGINLK